MKAKVENVTPQLAAKWLERNYVGNRPLSQKRVDGFAADMKAGAWRLTHQGICFGANGDLVDGQHRLHGVVTSGAAVRMLVVTDPSIKFHSPIDRGQSRTLALVSGRTNWEIATISALMFLEQGTNSRRSLSIEDARVVQKRNASAFAELTELQGFTKMRGGVAAALIYTYPISSKRVVRYAKDLIDGSMLQPGHVAITHRRWIDRAKSGLSNWDCALASLGCLRSHLQGATVAAVHTADAGYRAISAKRRSLGISHTPNTDRVAHISFKIDSE